LSYRLVCVASYLGEKAVHLFLQTELSTELIQHNLEGHRDDLVPALAKYEIRLRKMSFIFKKYIKILCVSSQVLAENIGKS
jgi:hypothetical protein